MRKYEFDAVTSTGQEIHTTIDGNSEAEAFERIRQMGYFVIRIREVSSQESWLGKLFRRTLGARTSLSAGRKLTTDEIGTPVARKVDADLRGETVEAALDTIPTQELIAICEQYWNQSAQSPEQGSKISPAVYRDRYSTYVRAVNALSIRGPEMRDWASRLLGHPDYDARETAAFLVGELGARGQLGEAVNNVINELGALINRPFEHDPPKEAQAIDVAIGALAKIGHANGIAILRHVLFSDKQEHEGDTQWAAAVALEKLVRESFLATPDPLHAARGWLQTHPDA
jgi:hypothetical protein